MENTQSSGQAPPREYPIVDAVAMKIKQTLRSLEPSPDVTQHFRNARVEVLKGFRQMIDNRIQRLSRTSAQGQKLTVE